MKVGRLLLSSVIILILTVVAVGQDNFPRPSRADYPSIRKSGKALADFVPKGFEIVMAAEGDLNGDGIADAAVHVIGKFERFIKYSEWGSGWDLNPRILFVVFGDREKNYRVVKQSNTFILSPYSLSHSEPLTDISIKNGILKFDFELWQSMGSWSATEASYKFRFQNGDFKLIGVDRWDYQRNSSEGTFESYNFLTRRVKVTDKQGDNVVKVAWKSFPYSRLQTFETFAAPFTWKVARYTYL